ncbi:unnamed protein product [Tetraodon nigroviridis]|uniref:(spotted green pufferfish) hypothetical protein n=1 Tax=Tetraodon nigroviridis TaxID=99883 RepID=Q4SLB0_TETNG|nr:unnamed protein product [Tetraodon nigroviridis]
MSCIPASHSMKNIVTQAESELEESPGERRGSRAFQIFPEVNKNEEADSCAENVLYRRERLPSIVVEPTEHNELEKQQKDVTMEPGSGVRKSSISPSQSQMSLIHLTPPTSPTPPEAAPPCLRS